MRPEDYAPLKRAADAGRVQLLDLGVGLRHRQLLDQPQARRVRRTIRAPPGFSATSCARRSRWPSIASSSPTPCISAPACRSSGRSRRRTGVVLDATCRRRRTIRRGPGAAGVDRADRSQRRRHGSRTRRARPARFTLLTQKGQTPLERGAAVIRDELAKIGLTSTSWRSTAPRWSSGSCRDARLRRGLLQHPGVGHRSGGQPRLLVQLRVGARVEHGAGDSRRPSGNGGSTS